MEINSQRLKERIDLINSKSVDKNGGYTRLAFSKEDIEAREAVKIMMEEAGLSVRVDQAGNIIGSIGPEGKPCVAAGSHIDTVRNGGPFDGLLGAIAAIEVAQCLNEKGVNLSCPVEIIIFSDEEGTRFNAGLIGSKYMVGETLDAPFETYVDIDGVSLSEALTKMDLDPLKLWEAKAPDGKYKVFLELHIEQSVILDRSKKQIGIVEGIKAPYWVKGCFKGESNHAGGTPMSLRKDALTGAADFISQANKIAREMGDMFVLTIGHIKAWPGGVNIIPNKVDFTLDIRDIDYNNRQKGLKLIEDAAKEAASRYGLEVEMECIKDLMPVTCDIHLTNVIEQVCKENAYDYMRLPSGASHDAQIMNKITPIGMIFVPSIGGVSHSPYENTNWEDIYAGADVLYKTMLKLVQ